MADTDTPTAPAVTFRDRDGDAIEADYRGYWCAWTLPARQWWAMPWTGCGPQLGPAATLTELGRMVDQHVADGAA